MRKGDKAIWLPRDFGKPNPEHPWYGKEVMVIGIEANQYGRLRVQILDTPKDGKKHRYTFWANSRDLVKKEEVDADGDENLQNVR